MEVFPSIREATAKLNLTVRGELITVARGHTLRYGRAGLRFFEVIGFELVFFQ